MNSFLVCAFVYLWSVSFGSVRLYSRPTIALHRDALSAISFEHCLAECCIQQPATHGATAEPSFTVGLLHRCHRLLLGPSSSGDPHVSLNPSYALRRQHYAVLCRSLGPGMALRGHPDKKRIDEDKTFDLLGCACSSVWWYAWAAIAQAGGGWGRSHTQICELEAGSRGSSFT